MAEHGLSGLAPEWLGNPLGDHHAAQGQVAAGDALGKDDHRRLEVPSLDPEPRAEPAEGADHRIGHQQRTGALTQPGDPLEVPASRRMDAAGADHRLDEHRRNAFRAEPLNRLLHIPE